MMLQRMLRWVLSPLLYAVGALSLFIIPVASLASVERQAPDNAALIGTLLAFLGLVTLIFVFLGAGLVGLERLRPPTVRDHLRHCALLYVVMALLGPFIVVTHDGQYCCSLQWALAVLLSLVAAYAVVVDAATVYVLAHHFRP
jgi:hypothetical protein